MPILMPQDTKNVLGINGERCQSRSLYFDRFAHPSAKKQERQDWFAALLKKVPEKLICQSRSIWIRSLSNHNVLYAQLQSRLMVNMSGGVMENAGLCLDRFGMPYIPGSAVKGCARRMATQLLLEAPVDKKAGLLADIAMIFGWGDSDWKCGRNKNRNGKEENPVSDFWWAMAEGDGSSADTERNNRWNRVAEAAATLIFNDLGLKPSDSDKPLSEQMPNFCGRVSFLPAFPIKTGIKMEPELGKMELDVVTCHHPDYYSQKKERGRVRMPVAFDNEPPNPVVFPTVATGAIFVFTPLPIRGEMQSRSRADTTLNDLANQWLAAGLATFGIGAKTNAGYGWFDSSENLQKNVRKALADAERIRLEEIKRQNEEQRLKAAEKDRLLKIEQAKAVTANMTPEEKDDYMLAGLSDDQIRALLDDFVRKEPAQQKAIVRALRLQPDQSGSRRSHWEGLKSKAQKKGGKWAQTEQLIRQISKQMFPGKEGKMP